MASNVQFPIRAKLLLLMSGIVLAATAAYLGLAVRLFEQDKISLVYELNASNVKTLAAESESTLLRISDKIKLLTQGHKDEQWTRAVFETEPDLVAYTLYQQPLSTDGAASAQIEDWKPVVTVRNPEYLKLYGLQPNEIDHIRARIPIPFGKVLSKRSWVLNSTIPGGAPILTLAMAIEVKDTEAGGEYVAVADLRLDKLLKLLSGNGVATSYLVDGEGTLVAHPDGGLVAQRASMGDIPIVREAVEAPVAMSIKQFEWKGAKWVGAYANVGMGGLHVISQVREDEAFRAARRLVEKSVLFALVVITAALLISGMMARGFTDPLEKLLEATEKLSRWEFGGSIHVRTRDEIARLARAFNSMAADLQSQRKQLENNRAELELKVRERTEALENEKKQLAEAQDALVRTTRLASLGELAGAAAHEVLNPVNNMNIRVERIRNQVLAKEWEDARLFNDILTAWKGAYAKGGWAGLEQELRKPADGGKGLMVDEDLENLCSIAADTLKRLGEREEDVEFIGKEITRVTRIINNMRALSRVGGERRPLDVHAPLDETSLALGDLFQKRKVALVKDYSADARDLFTVVGDKDELVQVFSNLYRNALHAIDAAKRRAPELRVTTRRSGERVEVRITDNGTGIKQEHLARIFEPSFTTKSVEEGTGLGLSISRRLVRAFGGDIEIESTSVGDGTTFLVWFPAGS